MRVMRVNHNNKLKLAHKKLHNGVFRPKANKTFASLYWREFDPHISCKLE